MYFSKEIFFIFMYFNINCIISLNARFIRRHNKRSFSASGDYMEGLLKLKGRMLANAVLALEKQQGDSENDKRHNSSDPKFDFNYLGSFPIATPRTLRVEDITEPKLTNYPTCPPTTTEPEHVKQTTGRMPYSHKYQHKDDNREEETATRRQQTEEVTHRYDNSKHKPPNELGEGEEATKKHDDNKEDAKTQKPTNENREGEEVTRKHESNEEVTKKNDADRENKKQKPPKEDPENEEVTGKNDTDKEEATTKNEDKKQKPADENREDEDVAKKQDKNSDKVTNKCEKKQKPTESNREGEEITGKPKEKVEKPTNEKEEATEKPDTDNENVEKTTVRQRAQEGDKSTDEKPPETNVEKPQTKSQTETTPSSERDETTQSSTREQIKEKDKEEEQSKDKQTTTTKTSEEKPKEKIKEQKEEDPKEQKEDKPKEKIKEQQDENPNKQKEEQPTEKTGGKTTETTKDEEEEEEECEDEETETEPTTRVPSKTLIKIVVVQPTTTTTESGQDGEDSDEECEPEDEETEDDKTATAKSKEMGKKCFALTTPSYAKQVTAAGMVYQNAQYPIQGYPGSYPAVTQCYPLGQTYNYPTAMQPPPAMQPYPPPPSPPPAMQPNPPAPDIQPYPTVTQTYPTVTQAYPMATQAYPMATQAYPMATQAYPLETRTYPTETQAYPTTAQSYPTITQCYPIETQSYPAATQSYPTVPQSYPPAAQPYPQTYPTVTQSYPTVTQCYPVDTQPYPTATQSYPTEYQTSANSTQEATTQTNQQTIFSLVTSNVTQNATAPPPSLGYATTCFPITETPTTVKPASRKRRLYKIRRHIGSGGFHKHTRTPYMQRRKKRRRVKRELREHENNFIDSKKLSSLVHLAAQPHVQRSLMHGLRGSTNSNYNHRNFVNIDYPDEEQGPKYARRSKVLDSIDYNTNIDADDQSNIFEDTMRVKLPLCPTKPPATETMSDTCSGKNHNIQHFKQPLLPKPCPLPIKPCKIPSEELKDFNFEPTEFPMPIPNIGGSMKFNDTCKQQEPSNEPNLSANDFTSNNNEDRASDECDDFGIEQFLKKSDAQIALENFRKAEANDPISQKLSFMGRLLGRNSKCADKNKPPCESKSKGAAKKPCATKTMESQSYLDIDTPTTSISPFKRILSNWLKSKPNCDICHQKVKLNDILHHRESIKKLGEGTTKFRRQNRRRAQNVKLRRSDSACINNHLSEHLNPEHYRTHANKRRNPARYMNKAVNAKFMPHRNFRRRSIIRRPRYAYEESNSRLNWRDADDMPDLSLNWEGDSGYDRNNIY